jgi:hypothetical protein
MIRKLRKFLFTAPRRTRSRMLFNQDLLERQRNDVFVLMHQQMGGLR